MDSKTNQFVDTSEGSEFYKYFRLVQYEVKVNPKSKNFPKDYFEQTPRPVRECQREMFAKKKGFSEIYEQLKQFN